MKRVFIFDLDGTLYYQLGVQLTMGLWMLSYYLIHFWRFKELLAILKYRKNREEGKDNIVDEQFKIVAQKYNLSTSKMEKIVKKWIMEKPLRVLPLFKDKKLVSLIAKLKEENKTIVIYSDYPTEEKLKVLDVKYDYAYDSSHPKIRVLKPDEKGLKFIISHNKFNKNNIIFIGDRDSKDGECARRCGIDYIILPKFFRDKKIKSIRQSSGE